MEILAITFAPVFLLLFYFYIRDKYEEEPLQRIFVTFIVGMIASIPILVFEIITAYVIDIEGQGIGKIFKESFIVAGFVEELFKFIVVITTIYFSRHFNEPYDGIIYTVSASLGFATVENVMYVLTLGTLAGIFRAFTALPAHAFFGVIMGFFVGLSKFTRTIIKKIFLMLIGILIAVFLHGLYNFLLFTGTPIMMVMTFVLLIMMGSISYLFTIIARKKSPFKKH